MVKGSRDIIAEDHCEAQSDISKTKAKEAEDTVSWLVHKPERLFLQPLQYFQKQNLHGKLTFLGSVQTNNGNRQGKGSVWQEGSLSAVVQKQFTEQLVCARQHVSTTDTLKSKT